MLSHFLAIIHVASCSIPKHYVPDKPVFNPSYGNMDNGMVSTEATPSYYSTESHSSTILQAYAGYAAAGPGAPGPSPGGEAFSPDSSPYFPFANAATRRPNAPPGESLWRDFNHPVTPWLQYTILLSYTLLKNLPRSWQRSYQDFARFRQDFNGDLGKILLRFCKILVRSSKIFVKILTKSYKILESFKKLSRSCKIFEQDNSLIGRKRMSRNI
jgi:hypothetical protein